MGDLFTRNLKKQSARAKEKLLESLGKADRTTDEQFQEHSQDFQKQQKSAERLHKEIKNYVSCVRAMGQASKGFHEALREIYEPDWPGEEHVKAMSHSMELLWDDYCEKMTDQALNPLNSYTSQFPEMKTKIAKRSRKLVDYDGARHNFDTLRSNSKKPDEAKLQKAQEQLTVAKRIFDEINNELMDSLPALYDSRITFYVNNFQTIFNLEQTFHGESAKLTRELCNQMDELGHSLGRLRVPRQASVERDTSFTPASTSNDVKEEPKQIPPLEDTSKMNESPVIARMDKEIPSENRNGTTAGRNEQTKTEEPPNPFDSSSDGSRSGSRHGSKDSGSLPAAILEQETVKQAEEEKSMQEDKPPPPQDVDLKLEEPGLEERPVDSPPVVVPAAEAKADRNILYKVRATHRYTAEDSDELSFEAGEIISVLPYDDPDEQDEGWLMGMLETSPGMKGVFPANFTKPL